MRVRPVPAWHATCTGLLLGGRRARGHDAIAALAALGRRTFPGAAPARIYRISAAGPASSCAIRVVGQSCAARCSSTGGHMAEEHHVDYANRLSEEIKALVCGANFAHLATLMRDGAP